MTSIPAYDHADNVSRRQTSAGTPVGSAATEAQPAGLETRLGKPRRRHARAALLGWLVPLACVVGFCLPSTASAASIGFHIYNLSGTTLRLTSVTGDGYFEGRPADGTLLPPGAYQDFEVQTRAFTVQNDTAIYSIEGQPGQFIVRMTNDNNYLNVDAECDATGPYGCMASGKHRYGIGYGDSPTASFLDPPGTVHDVPAGQGQAQAAVLNQL
ncbi:MAG: hypothetical protein M3Y41_08500, partial [Pseudomonadota bacterium]|nr:hypothetical protein [Pseudomonadota bacterium]